MKIDIKQLLEAEANAIDLNTGSAGTPVIEGYKLAGDGIQPYRNADTAAGSSKDSTGLAFWLQGIQTPNWNAPPPADGLADVLFEIDGHFHNASDFLPKDSKPQPRSADQFKASLADLESRVQKLEAAHKAPAAAPAPATAAKPA